MDINKIVSDLACEPKALLELINGLINDSDKIKVLHKIIEIRKNCLTVIRSLPKLKKALRALQCKQWKLDNIVHYNKYQRAKQQQYRDKKTMTKMSECISGNLD